MNASSNAARSMKLEKRELDICSRPLLVSWLPIAMLIGAFFGV